MPTSIFTPCVARAVLWALPVSCLLTAAVSCRSTSRAVDATVVRSAADSLAVGVSSQQIIDMADDLEINVDEWYFYPTASSSDTGSPQMHRRVRVLHSGHVLASGCDTATVSVQARSSQVEESRSETHSEPQPSRLPWIAFAAMTILITIMFFKK